MTCSYLGNFQLFSLPATNIFLKVALLSMIIGITPLSSAKAKTGGANNRSKRNHKIFNSSDNYIGGKSKFDLLVEKNGIPGSFSELLKDIIRETGDSYQPRATTATSKTGYSTIKVIPFPQGRALSRLEVARKIDRQGRYYYKDDQISVLSNDDYFRFPRWVVGVTGVHSHNPLENIYLEDQLYFGFNERSQVLEVISYNEEARRFEFQLVTNFGKKSARVEYTNRQLCLACHQNHAPIFPRVAINNHGGLWGETLDNPAFTYSKYSLDNPGTMMIRDKKIEHIVDALRRLKIGRHMSIKDDDTISNQQNVKQLTNTDLDNSVEKANWINYGRLYWSQGCGQLPSLSLIADCRRSLFFAAVFAKVIANSTPHIPMSAISALQPESQKFLNNLIRFKYKTSFNLPVIHEKIKNRDAVKEPPFPQNYSPIACGNKLSRFPMCPRPNRVIRSLKDRKKYELTLTDKSIASLQGQFFNNLEDQRFLKKAFPLLANFLSYRDALTLIGYSGDFQNFLTLSIEQKSRHTKILFEKFANTTLHVEDDFWLQQEVYVRRNILPQFASIPVSLARSKASPPIYIEGNTKNRLKQSTRKYKKAIQYCGACHRGGPINIFGGESDREIAQNLRKYFNLIPLRTDYANIPEGHGMPPVNSVYFKTLARTVMKKSWKQIISFCKGKTTTLLQCVQKFALTCETLIDDTENSGFRLQFGKCNSRS